MDFMLTLVLMMMMELLRTIIILLLHLALKQDSHLVAVEKYSHLVLDDIFM